MGKRGPPPIPTHLKIMRGNRGHETGLYRRREPQAGFSPAVLEPPSYMIGYAREEWDRVAIELFEMGLLARVDEVSLAAYCDAYAIWRTTVEQVNVEGILIEKAGGVMQNPLITTGSRAAREMLRYAQEFGFTPSARSRISTLDAEVKSGKFGKLIAG